MSFGGIFFVSSAWFGFKKDVSNPSLRQGRHDMLLGKTI
jgi:hypothetical protein